MPIRNRLMGMFPDIGSIRSEMDEKFGELVDHLVQINATLELVLAELRTQRGAPQ